MEIVHQMLILAPDFHRYKTLYVVAYFIQSLYFCLKNTNRNSIGWKHTDPLYGSPAGMGSGALDPWHRPLPLELKE